VNYKDKAEFEKQVEQMYKPLMQQLIMDWKERYDSATIRQCFCFWVVKHAHEKILDAFNHRKHRKLKYAKVKHELETLKVKNSLENLDFLKEDK
jgi:hypothetical protein